MCLTDDPRLIPRSFHITQPNQLLSSIKLATHWAERRVTDLQGLLSCIRHDWYGVADWVSGGWYGVADCQWRLGRGSASPHIVRAQPLPLAAPRTPGIWFAESARSPAPALHLLVVVPGVMAEPPVLAAVGGGTTTSLLRLRHDK